MSEKFAGEGKERRKLKVEGEVRDTWISRNISLGVYTSKKRK